MIETAHHAPRFVADRAEPQRSDSFFLLSSSFLPADRRAKKSATLDLTCSGV
jgi:hypothetical protein